MAIAAPKPDLRPANPAFSSGPCAKRPGWTLDALSGAFLGRSHRAREPKARLAEVIARDDAENVSVDGLLDARPGDFLLRIKGDSMTGDGILNEDLVLIRPSDPVRQGEIAAVIATGAGSDWDATLKHLHWLDRGRPVPPDRATEVRLRASNPAYPDILLPPEGVRVAGVFRGLIRQGTQGRLNPHASSS